MTPFPDLTIDSWRRHVIDADVKVLAASPITVVAGIPGVIHVPLYHLAKANIGTPYTENADVFFAYRNNPASALLPAEVINEASGVRVQFVAMDGFEFSTEANSGIGQDLILTSTNDVTGGDPGENSIDVLLHYVSVIVGG